MIYVGAGFDFHPLLRKYNDKKNTMLHIKLKNVDKFTFVDKIPIDTRIFETIEQFIDYVGIKLRMFGFNTLKKGVVKEENYIKYTISYRNFTPITLTYVYKTCLKKLPDKFKKDCNILYIKALPIFVTNEDILKAFPNVRTVVSWKRKFEEHPNHNFLCLNKHP